LETCCGYWYGRVWKARSSSLGPRHCAPRTRAARHALLCLVSQRSAEHTRLAGKEGSRHSSCPPLHAARRRPQRSTARKSSSGSLSVACHCALRPRLTFCRSPTQKNPSPPRSSEFPSESLLLPPRSAPQAPPHAPAHVLRRHPRAPLLRRRTLVQHETGVRGIGPGLQRHPFSERPNSAGTLQHVS